MRIGATISGFELQLLNSMAEANSAAGMNALRLATGRRINKPADDPTDFLQISKLEGQLDLVNRAAGRVDEASSMVAQTQLTIDQIRTQLDTIRTALVADENQTLTTTQRAQKQAEIDSALAEINKLAATEIGGRRRLEGSTDFTVTGEESAEFRAVQVFSVGSVNEITGAITQKAEQAELTYTGTGGLIINTSTITVTGKTGSASVSVTAGETLAAARDKINNVSHKTGVTAKLSNGGDKIIFNSVEYGSEANITIKVTSGGPFALLGGDGSGSDSGVDAKARINGQTVTGDGNVFFVNQSGLSARLEFQNDFAGQFNRLEISDERVDRFALGTDITQLSSLGLPGLQTARLGGQSGSLDDLKSGGSLAGLNTNTAQAIRVVDEAIGQLTLVEGRVDGFANAAIASAEGLLDGFESSLTQALTDINGIDENAEALLQSKNAELADSALASLAILDQQRAGMVNLLQQIAGLI